MFAKLKFCPKENFNRFTIRLLLGFFIIWPQNEICQAEKKVKYKSIPFEQLKRSEEYKKALDNRVGHGSGNPKELYSTKWFEPGSFYGQVFLSENGYLTLFEWLEVPKTYSLVETKVSRENEYLLAQRSFINNKSHFIELSIVAPHPRSFEAIKLGLVPKYLELFPAESNIESRSEIQIDEYRKAELVTLKSGASRLIYTSAAGTRLSVAIEHFRFNQSSISFLKSLNLGLFDQRIQS